MTGWIALGCAVIALAYNTWLIMHSHPYRNDLNPGESIRSGSAPFWQLNVLNPDNYTSREGRRVYRRIILSGTFAFGAWLLALLLLTQVPR